jgi:aspartate/methionine/tyrosine aminotransferase
MAQWSGLPAADLNARIEDLQIRYDAAKAKGLALDMTRGKPCPEQLDLAVEMLGILSGDDYKAVDGTDCRNYGVLDGIPEAKALFGAYLDAPAEQILIGGNSSLNLMYDAVSRAVLYGVPGGSGPWGTGVRFLCPAPGYDRHFAICQHLGIGMIPVPMTDEGPDMDEVERLAAGDASIKGMWCVPKFSNPTGAVYSDAVVDRLAAMPTAADDFRLFWDNAYAVHWIYEEGPALKNILTACGEAGHADRPLVFGSTSKISFAGAGLGFLAASPANIADQKSHLKIQTIGYDKLNQLRHIRFFKDMDGIRAHMAAHAEILRPKFDAVLSILDRELTGKEIATWTRPVGGYFVSLDILDGCAGEVVRLAAEAGLKLTAAGATFPYGEDPKDANIRLAPTLPSVAEIETAMELVCICIQLAAAKKLAAA